MQVPVDGDKNVCQSTHMPHMPQYATPRVWADV